MDLGQYKLQNKFKQKFQIQIANNFQNFIYISASMENIQSQIFGDFLPHIKPIKRLGEGAFAQVFLIFDQIQNIYLAVKKISLFGLSQYERKLVLNQAKILSSIQHPNIIKFHSCLYDNNQENVFIFMQYAQQGDLLNLIEECRYKNEYLKQKIIWKILCDIAQALRYLHSNNIIHRDVKPANILQQGSSFKLADMNVSKIKQKGKRTCTNIGTPLYTSPQVAKNEFYNEKCDIWSLGVVIYQMCCLRNPFTRESLGQISQRDEKKIKSMIEKIPLFYSKALSDLIKKMLIKDPEQRITTKQIIRICQSQGINATCMPSNQQIVQFKTIVFPPSSQRWINLVKEGHRHKKCDLDLTIDQILQRESQLQQDNQLNSVLMNQENQFSTIKLIQDEYCLSSIRGKRDILKSKQQNFGKYHGFGNIQAQKIKRNDYYMPYAFQSKQSKQNVKSNSKSTDKYRKFQRQKSKSKGGLSCSKQKSHPQYGFKFIKLSKDLLKPHS